MAEIFWIIFAFAFVWFALSEWTKHKGPIHFVWWGVEIHAKWSGFDDDLPA